MLVDNVKLYIKAGDGGNGASSFKRSAQTRKGGPDGGNGGNGGNVYVQGSSNINDLKEFRFKKEIKAVDGTPGSSNNLYGKNAPHLTILLPLGTKVTDIELGKLAETKDTKPILIAHGGRGGRGNNEFKSATNQAPKFAEKGTKGDELNLILELKIIADVGLIGLPNAGKSSLLATLTNAEPKIGNYPFTTLEPNIGVMNNLTIADIPGLIEGASKGKGLGINFLKHIEKTEILIHCIDSNEDNPEKVYQTVRQEFKEYNELLLNKIEIILFTKTDLVPETDLKKKIKKLQKYKKKILSCSIYNPESLDLLKREINKEIKIEKKLT